jgi:predicted metal-dependent hydrolase
MNIEVTYRKTNRLTMRILKNGDLHVTVPLGYTKAELKAFLEQNQEWIRQARQNTFEREKRRQEFFSKLPLETREQGEEAYRRLQQMIPPLVEKYARLINVKPGRIYYKAMISQWGRCNVKNHDICFSAYLLLLPDWCVEHVVVHELAHLKEANHGASFHALMDTYFPRWREARKETIRISGMEE